MPTAQKRAEGETGDPAPSSDEEQQQHISGKRIDDAQLDDGLRDRSIRNAAEALRAMLREKCDDQDIVYSATLDV
ncbi:hypothetical protein HaLaN_26363 [Haematococcus lacustris]|uniref:Uncharacterized protein n=1 Tax=Haematococcus lacustris TaxID=44745 RepID=A0A6A0A624_HAELA|nr:hypothetical protein HaLaN_26363 [Haematococcus lacustris]